MSDATPTTSTNSVTLSDTETLDFMWSDFRVSRTLYTFLSNYKYDKFTQAPQDTVVVEHYVFRFPKLCSSSEMRRFV